jgi:hypothetical protein
MDPANTGIAVLTNGGLFELDAAHKGWKFVTTAAGLLGFTITAAADSYWACFEKPNGSLGDSRPSLSAINLMGGLITLPLIWGTDEESFDSWVSPNSGRCAC